MKAGKYWIGDLCYVLDKDGEWDQFCNLTFKGGDVLHGVFTLPDGREFGTLGTAYGDGTYEDEQGRYYDVDAGIIGCILADSITDERGLGNVVEIAEDFEPHHDGTVLVFGPVRIETGD